jgi:hypothetical protein
MSKTDGSTQLDLMHDEPHFSRSILATKKEKRGNCYVTSEALYHLLGGKDAGWQPMNMRHAGDSHWFLKHRTGIILDATASQFLQAPDYRFAKARGFLTSYPSKRATELMRRLVWQSNAD